MSALLQLILACPGPSAYVDKPVDSGEVSDTGADGDTGDSAADSAEPADTSELLDQDDDGYRPLDGDCDDHLSHVHPGADDFCDALDQDCDGEPIPDGSCSVMGDASKMWSWALADTETLTGWSYGSAGDVDGDGLMDLRVQNWNSSDPENWLATQGTLYGRYWAGMPAVAEYPEVGFDEGWSVFTYGNQVEAGDIDGDGYSEMLVYTRDTEYTLGGVFLYYGRPDSWPVRGPRLDESSDAYWLADGEYDSLDVEDGGDFDGDGYTDLLIASYVPEEGRGLLAMVRGGPTRYEGVGSLSELPQSEGFGVRNVLRDLDGDGSDELVDMGDRNELGDRGMAILEGEDVVPGVALGDLLHWSWYEGDLSESTPWPLTNIGGEPGDWDGDGYNDLALGPQQLTGGCVSLKSGSVPEGDAEAGEFARVCGLHENSLTGGMSGWVPDVDDDGQAELLMGRSNIVPSRRVAVGGTVEAAEVCAPCFDIEARYGGSMRAAGDMTGDGFADYSLIVLYSDYDPGLDTDNLYATAIVLGFDIPWDDPSKW